MTEHRDNRHYVQWSLDATAELLCKKFPTSNVFIVKASEMSLGTFSSYSNFVFFDELGIPRHKESEFCAWNHLKSLTTNALKCALDAKVISTPTEQDKEKLHEQPIDIIGFSKGCVVLNQLLYELNSKDSIDTETNEFIQRVRSITWLDGGHAGHGEPTWVVDANVLSSLKATNIEVDVHVTPYQVKDEMRPWKGKEYRKFINAMKRLELKCSSRIHFEDEAGSIEKHFQLLQDFKPDIFG